MPSRKGTYGSANRLPWLPLPRSCEDSFLELCWESEKEGAVDVVPHACRRPMQELVSTPGSLFPCAVVQSHMDFTLPPPPGQQPTTLIPIKTHSLSGTLGILFIQQMSWYQRSCGSSRGKELRSHFLCFQVVPLPLCRFLKPLTTELSIKKGSPHTVFSEGPLLLSFRALGAYCLGFSTPCWDTQEIPVGAQLCSQLMCSVPQVCQIAAHLGHIRVNTPNHRW